MREPHDVIKTELSFDKTLNLNRLIGKEVLSKGGKVIGKISEIRINPKNLELEGVLIKREITEKPLFIGKSYFAHLSQEAIILNIEVSVLIKDRPIIDSEGKKVGKVKDVARHGSRNNLKGIYVKPLFQKRFFIPASEIDNISKAVILKSDYNATKKRIWQSNKQSYNV